MSMDDAYKFCGLATTSFEVGQEFSQLTEGKADPEKAQVATDLGRRHGMEFTPDEILRARAAIDRKLDDPESGELSDEDLEAVAGGWSSDAAFAGLAAYAAGQLAHSSGYQSLGTAGIAAGLGALGPLGAVGAAAGAALNAVDNDPQLQTQYGGKVNSQSVGKEMGHEIVHFFKSW